MRTDSQRFWVLLLILSLAAVSLGPSQAFSGDDADAAAASVEAQESPVAQADSAQQAQVSGVRAKERSADSPAYYILTISDLVNIALEKNYDLRIKQKEAQSSFFQYLQIAGESGLSINLMSSLRRSGPLQTFEFGPPGSAGMALQKETTSTTSITAAYPIAPLGNFGFGKKAAYAAYQAKQALVDKEMSASITAAYSAYVGYLTAEHAQAVAEEGLSLAEEQLRNATLRFQAGDAPRFEVIQGEVAVSQAKEELVQAHNGYQLARSALFLAIGVVPQDYFHGKPVAIGYQDTLTRAVENIRDRIFPTLDGEKLAAEYVEKTPDYASLQSSIDSLNYQVKGWRRAPFVTLDASYSHQSGSLMMKRNNYSFGITANLNVFDSLKTESKQRMLSAQKQALDVQMERYRQAFRLGVRDAVSTLESAIQGWETSQHTLEQATEGLRMSRLGYQEGVVTHADLLSSRTAYLGAELNEFSRRLAVLTAYQDLLTKLGITEPSAYLPATEAALPRSLMQEKEAQDEQNH